MTIPTLETKVQDFLAQKRIEVASESRDTSHHPVMTYDRVAGAIGPFEMLECVGLALVWGTLAVTAPFGAAGRPVPSTG